MLPLLRCYVQRFFQHYARVHTHALVAETQRRQAVWLAVGSHHHPVTLTHLDYNARGIARHSNSASDMHLPAAMAASLSQNHWPVESFLLVHHPRPLVDTVTTERFMACLE